MPMTIAWNSMVSLVPTGPEYLLIAIRVCGIIGAPNDIQERHMASGQGSGLKFVPPITKEEFVALPSLRLAWMSDDQRARLFGFLVQNTYARRELICGVQNQE